ncbi:MAG: translation initiation factor IF-2 subunit beta [Methanobacteriota archaeon]
MQDYNALLLRARSKIPQSMASGERVILPEPDIMVEGKNTVLKNFMDIVEAVRREPDHLLHYLLRELGTAGNVEGRRAILKRKLSDVQVRERLQTYYQMYVICTECNRPDSHLVKEDRVLMLECEACGARRPVKAIKAATEEKVAVLEEGKVYEVMIEDVGKRGDGIARVDKYIIYVPGASRGDKVKVKIEKITGTTAFCHISNE